MLCKTAAPIVRSALPVLLVFAFVAGLPGCRESMPHSATWWGGTITRTHPKPAEGGYYTDWDPYAATIELQPVEDVNPVNTQHILVATVRDKEGRPLPNRRVEWIITDGVGAIVEVDASGWRESRGHKEDNRFAITHTNNGPHTLTRGNDDPRDDIVLGEGQTWCVITSPVEGTSHVIAYAPGIYNWDKHKVFAKKHWFDVAWRFPAPATNPVCTPHEMITQVARHSDGAALGGYEVTYRLVGGPPAVFCNGQQAVCVRTDAQGLGRVVLQQTAPAEGVNEIEITVVRPGNERCCIPAQVIAVGRTTKTWVGPRIAIAKQAPPSAVVGERFRYTITVSNPAQVPAPQVCVYDFLPPGIQYQSSTPAAHVNGQTLTWSVGTLEGGGSRTMTVDVAATRSGRFTNCADVRAAYGLAARATAETCVTQPQLALTKTAPPEALQCELIPHSVVVTNTGTAPARNVRFFDKLPEGMVWQERYTGVESDLGTLNPGESRRLCFYVKAQRTGTFTNTATVTAEGGLSAQATATTVVRNPALVITKVGPARRFVGKDITYTITLANRGDGEARNTYLCDRLPPTAQFVKASEGATVTDGTVVWSLGTLAPGASRSVEVTLRSTQVGELTNVARATAYCADATGQAVTQVVGIPAILLECTDHPDPIAVGQTTVYTVTVTNQGSAPGTNIVIAAELPPQQDLVSTDGPTRATVEGKTLTFAAVESLPPQASAVYRITAKGTAPGDVRFKVALTSDQMATPAMETESTNIYGE